MEWIVIFIIVVVGFFVLNGFKTRCPLCGEYSLHPKDEDANRDQTKHYNNLKKSGLGDALDEVGSSFGSAANKPGYANSHFRCKSCNHPFSRKQSVTWLTAANKIGEEKAIEEYRKLKEE